MALNALCQVVNKIDISPPDRTPAMNTPSPFKDFINNKNFSDLKIIAEGKVIHASKMMISSQSEYFKTLFQGGMKDSKENVVEIKDIEYDITLKIIEFLYTQEVDIKSVEEAFKLLKFADQFQLSNLKQELAYYLSQHLNEQCVQLFWERAIDYGVKTLQIQICEWLLSNLDNLVKTDFGLALIKYLISNQQFEVTLQNHLTELLLDRDCG